MVPHSSMDYSALSILLTRVWVPITQSTIFHLNSNLSCTFVFALWKERTNKKSPGLAYFFKKRFKNCFPCESIFEVSKRIVTKEVVWVPLKSTVFRKKQFNNIKNKRFGPSYWVLENLNMTDLDLQTCCQSYKG